MNKRGIYTITLCILLALGGLIYVQTALVQEGRKSQRQLLVREMRNLQIEIANGLEAEASYHVMDQALDEATASAPNHQVTWVEQNGRFLAYIEYPERTDTFRAPTRQALDSILRAEQIHPALVLRQNMERYIESLTQDFYLRTIPLAERLDTAAFHRIVQTQLDKTDEGGFVLYALADSSRVLPHYNNLEGDTFPAGYQRFTYPLFTDDWFQAPLQLTMALPENRLGASAANRKLLLFGLLFMLLLTAGFFGFLYILLRQRRLSELKNDFINNMTHELKTPVSTISLATEMLMRKNIANHPDKLQHYSQIIKMENQRLGSHIERVLQAAHLEREKLKLKIEPCEINQLVEQTLAKFQLRLQSMDAEVQWSLHPDRLPVKADKMMIMNALSNIVDNAIKYRQEGRPLVLTIETAKEKEFARVSIRDNGIGMDPSALQKIFTRFYRVPTGNVHNVKGFGLGLSYVQSIIAEHKGTVKAESEAGQFSKFTIRLPLKKS